MDKVKIFLEKHVQWIALGLGVAYLLYMGYSNIYTPPLTAKLGNEDVLPGEIDVKISQGPAKQLADAIKRDDYKRPPVVAVSIKDKIAEKDWTNPLAIAVNTGTYTAPVVGPAIIPIADAKKIDKLIALPMVTIKQITKPRWTVINVSGTRKDTAYFSATGAFDPNILTKEYADKGWDKLPPQMLQVVVDQVELWRKESPDGVNNWSAGTLIKPINAADLKPRPEDSAPMTDKLTFVDWAMRNQEAITHPAFYPTAPDAEIWIAPGITPVQAQPQPGQAAPVQPVIDVQEEQRKARELRKQQYLQREQARRAQQQHGAPGAFIPPQVVPPPPHPGAPAPVAPLGAPPVVRNNPNPNPPAFNPAVDLAADDFLVHDATIQEGKKYKYAIRYRVLNPLFTKTLLATTDVTTPYDISSQDPNTPEGDKLWSEVVGVDPTAHLFVTHVDVYGQQAEFDVFVWKDGHWVEFPKSRGSYGDAVKAGPAATAWTIVDIRKDTHSNEAYVILTDEHGVLMRRDEKSDQQNPDLQNLKNQAAAPKAAAALVP